MDWLLISTIALLVSAVAGVVLLRAKTAAYVGAAWVTLIVAQIILAVSWRVYDPAGWNWLAPAAAVVWLAYRGLRRMQRSRPRSR